MKKQSEIKALLADKLGISKSEADKFLKAYTEIILDELILNGKFRINQIGILKVRYRRAKKGYNPKTKTSTEIGENLTAGLTASEPLKKNLNKKIDIKIYRK